jgi:hypothetical protein
MRTISTAEVCTDMAYFVFAMLWTWVLLNVCRRALKHNLNHCITVEITESNVKIVICIDQVSLVKLNTVKLIFC